MPLTAVGLHDFWLGYYGTAAGSMFMCLALPSFTIEDLRQGISPEQRLVLSTLAAEEAAVAGAAPLASRGPASSFGARPVGLPSRLGQHHAPVAASMTTSSSLRAGRTEAPRPLVPSLLTLEYRSVRPTGGSPPAQAIRMRLQRPTLVLDFGLLLRLLNFVAPSPLLRGTVPRPYETRDVVLPPTTAPYKPPEKDVWLSPEVRLLADAPGGPSLQTYDGGGGRLVLPPGLAPGESLPLIVVGANRALQLKNVRIVNCASLPAVLSLGPGARLVAREEDGVKMVLSDPDTDREYMQVLAVAAAAAASASAASAGATAAPPPPPSVFEVSVDALGAAIHVIESHKPVTAALDEGPNAAAAGGGGLSALAAASAAAGGRGCGMLDSSGNAVQPGTASLPLAVRHTMARVGSGVGVASTAVAGGGQDLADDADGLPQRIRRRLVLQLDASASYRVHGAEQSASASLRGLTVTTLTAFAGGNNGGSGTVLATGLRPSAGASAGTTYSPALSKASSSNSLAQDSASAAASSRSGSVTTAAAAAAAQLAATPPSAIISTTLLEPADVSLSYKLTSASQDVSLDLGTLTLRLSPASLHLLLHLQGMVLQPLYAPAPDQPLCRCDRFERVWGSHASSRGSGGGGGGGTTLELGVGGVDAMAGERGVTVWRPQAPLGYARLGDVLAQGAGCFACVEGNTWHGVVTEPFLTTRMVVKQAAMHPAAPLAPAKAQKRIGSVGQTFLRGGESGWSADHFPILHRGMPGADNNFAVSTGCKTIFFQSPLSPYSPL